MTRSISHRRREALRRRCDCCISRTKAYRCSLKYCKDDTFTLEQVRESISNSIKKYFEEVAFKQELISYARIGKAVLETEGVLDYSELIINGVRENIMLDYEETPMLGEVMVSE